MDDVSCSELADRMAIEYIVRELGDKMIPEREARERACRIKEARTQEWLRTQHDMLGALVALEHLRYAVTAPPVDK